MANAQWIALVNLRESGTAILHTCTIRELDVIMFGTWILCGTGWSLIWTIIMAMVGPWMLCVNGWSLIWTLQYHDWPMDALRDRPESDLDVIIIGPWMLMDGVPNWPVQLGPGLPNCLI